MKIKLAIILLFMGINNAYSEEEFPPFDYDFYVLGWSKDGKIAFAVYKSFFDGYGEGTDYHFCIQDLITDKILEGKELVEQDNVYSIQEIIDKEKPWYNRVFNEYKIDVSKQGNEKLFPITTDKDAYDVAYTDTTIKKQDGPIDSWVGMLKIDLVRQSDGAIKQIYNKDLNGSYFTYAAKVVKSPFENRVAVALFLGRPGWEGVPYETTIEVIGSNLNVGFKKGESLR